MFRKLLKISFLFYTYIKSGKSGENSKNQGCASPSPATRAAVAAKRLP